MNASWYTEGQRVVLLAGARVNRLTTKRELAALAAIFTTGWAAAKASSVSPAQYAENERRERDAADVSVRYWHARYLSSKR